MTGEFLVSVVIPCHNAEMVVAAAVGSALDQTYQPVEVIVVDDGSTDGTAKVLRQFGDRICGLSGPNTGAAAARNRGALAARGELLQFLDADDLLYPTKLERQVPLAMRARPDLVFCDADVIDGSTGRLRGSWKTGDCELDDSVVHALRVIVQTAGPLHWRETFLRVGGFREETPPCDDRDLHLRLACAGVKFHRLPEALYVMRRFEGSLSKRNRSRGLRIQRAVGEDALRRLGGTESLSPARKAAFATFFAATGRVAFRLGDVDLGRDCFERATEILPNGVLERAYSPIGARLARLFGPALTERVATLAKNLRGHREIA